MTDSVFFNNKEDLKFYDNFFVLPKELSQLSTISKTQSNFCVLVSGNAGCGKTTLLRILAKELDTTGIKCCFLRGSDFEFHFRIANYEETDLHNAVFFIDGLDEAKDPEKIFNQLGKLQKVIITSRQSYYNFQFTDTIHIGPLTKKQCAKLIDAYLGPVKLAGDVFDILVDSSTAFTISFILRLINTYLSNSEQLRDALLKLGSKFSQKYKLGQGLYLQSPGLLVPEKPEIVIPEPIVNDFSVINSSLLSRVAKNPNLIRTCSSREFEELVCEMLDKKGYKVNLTNQTRDGGKDIIIVENNLLGSFLIYVECKHYSPDHPIGVKLVRELYGTISADNATAGLLITSSYFSKDAITFKNTVKNRISLMDYVQLISEIQKIC